MNKLYTAGRALNLFGTFELGEYPAIRYSNCTVKPEKGKVFLIISKDPEGIEMDDVLFFSVRVSGSVEDLSKLIYRINNSDTLDLSMVTVYSLDIGSSKDRLNELAENLSPYEPPTKPNWINIQGSGPDMTSLLNKVENNSLIRLKWEFVC